MATDEKKFLERLMQVFRQETKGHLETMSKLLQMLDEHECEQAPLKTMENLLLEVHSLKGAARAVNRLDIEGFCQEAESLLIRLRQSETMPSNEVILAFDQLVDYLDRAVVNPVVTDTMASPASLQSILRAL